MRKRALDFACLATLLALVLVVLSAAPALAQTDPIGGTGGTGTGGVGGGGVSDVENQLRATTQSLHILWITLGAILSLLVAGGLILMNSGFTRAKNAAHVVTSAFAGMAVAFFGFFATGFGLMFGGFRFSEFGFTDPVGGPLLGGEDFVFLWRGGFFLTGEIFTAPVMIFFLYMAVVAAISGFIPVMGMSERARWPVVISWSLFAGGLFYPLFGAWTWGGGWLSRTGNSLNLSHGFVDFGGSGVIFALGGAAAFAAALAIGARLGKYDPIDGYPRVMPGHNSPYMVFGAVLAMIGWVGLVGANTLTTGDGRFPIIAVNVVVAAMTAGAVASLYLLLRNERKPRPNMIARAVIGGLAAVSASAAFIDPWAGAVIGAIAAIITIESTWVVERRARIDDPMGVISAFGVSGLFGVLAVGIFANGEYGQGWNGTTNPAVADVGITGVLTDTTLGLNQLAAQALGGVVIWTVMLGISYIFFKAIDWIFGLKASENEELASLDASQMAWIGYPNFPTEEPVEESSTRGGPKLQFENTKLKKLLGVQGINFEEGEEIEDDDSGSAGPWGNVPTSSGPATPMAVPMTPTPVPQQVVPSAPAADMFSDDILPAAPTAKPVENLPDAFGGIVPNISIPGFKDLSGAEPVSNIYTDDEEESNDSDNSDDGSGNEPDEVEETPEPRPFPPEPEPLPPAERKEPTGTPKDLKRPPSPPPSAPDR